MAVRALARREPQKSCADTATGRARRPNTSRPEQTATSRAFALSAGWSGLPIQRKCAACEDEEERPIARAAADGAISMPSDPSEIEAEHVADQVMRMADGTRAALAIHSRPSRASAARVGASCAEGGATHDVSALVSRATSGGGDALDPGTRTFMESRFGRDFGDMRVHTGAGAAGSARAMNALAFTAGRDIVFAGGRYEPNSDQGRRLIAHELVHTVQPHDGAAIHRQTPGPGGATPACGPPPGCPPSFCTPLPGGSFAAGLARDIAAPGLLLGIARNVNTRVVPLWRQYLFGGSAPQDLSGTFGKDFTKSTTTDATTDFLGEELRKDLETNPPTFPGGASAIVVDIPTRIPTAITAIGTPGDLHEMNFNDIGEIPGNIAGAIGKNQASCPVGAMPSPFDDDRRVEGTAAVTKNPDGSLTATTAIAFTVRDTVDLCPGNCGAGLEQAATLPMSRFEASGVSGDVPFVVRFAAPPRTVVAHPPAPGTGPASGEVIASALRIREAPSTSSRILGVYPRGAAITIECETTGTDVDGNTTWDKTDRGFVSDRYVRRTGSGVPPAC